MTTLPIYLYGHDSLRQTAKPVTGLDNTTIKLIYDMFETMTKANGIGLAATQVGEMKRVIVIDLSHLEEEAQDGEAEQEQSHKGERGTEKLVLINPEIMAESGSWAMEEGCLSIPDVRADVQRSETVRIRYRNANFEPEELEAEGLLGRVILHEIDHLNGVLFIDHLSGAKRSLLRGKLRKIKKGEVETSYSVVTAPARRRSGGVEV
ncbi:MAG: peptide deformylase [Ignavibacteriales bacterium]|nr:peptide deformylase [Ignavibacteriales bacterium]